MHFSTKAPTATDAKITTSSILRIRSRPTAARIFCRPRAAGSAAIGERQDYLRFETPVLDKNVAIAGPVDMTLWAATDGPDTDFMVKLVDVYPDGYEQIVLDNPIRTRYRHGRDPDDVTMMTPGKPEELHIDLWNTAFTFEKGHRIPVTVTSSNSTKFELNPNTGEPFGVPTTTSRGWRPTRFISTRHSSAMILPVL